MNCTRCHQPIPLARLEAVPDATVCVPCLSKAGDVPLKRGRLVFDHKTGGSLEVVSDAQLARLKASEAGIEERVSRL